MTDAMSVTAVVQGPDAKQNPEPGIRGILVVFYLCSKVCCCQSLKDYPVCPSTYTRVEACAIFPACCVSAEVGPGAMSSDEDVCWQLSGAGWGCSMTDWTGLFIAPYAPLYIVLLNIWACLMTHAVFFSLQPILILLLNGTIRTLLHGELENVVDSTFGIRSTTIKTVYRSQSQSFYSFQ